MHARNASGRFLRRDADRQRARHAARRSSRPRRYTSSVRRAVARHVMPATAARPASTEDARSGVIRHQSTYGGGNRALDHAIGTRRPVWPSRTIDRAHPTGVVTTGRRWLIASRMTRPKPS